MNDCMWPNAAPSGNHRRRNGSNVKFREFLWSVVEFPNVRTTYGRVVSLNPVLLRVVGEQTVGADSKLTRVPKSK